MAKGAIQRREKPEKPENRLGRNESKRKRGKNIFGIVKGEMGRCKALNFHRPILLP
jgi:hypothetical protein